VQTVTPSLTFKDGAEDALKLYVSVIRNSKIVNIMRSEGGPIAKGKVLHATFELDGRECTARSGEGSPRMVGKKARAAGSRIASGFRGRSFRVRSGR